ncbi:UvrD-helicase domain-containing protein [Caldichromatium japonicum]|uniref:RecBCD enzyme subunit RecB n=1 Tax=Caldichromatium japonicum TaxID=2699430 RepID=A0A6G7VEL8_9GAMM|nr:UvrD-helicase domain-containing protein [Caldichromatium japonicum]QIK38350.1 UvrD-helicase domain-containing protein [Caldichromatium japonicum]
MSCEPDSIQVLDPLRLPLHGSRLIEASAGTGKTFTLALLYLRLILGHGGDAAFARPLMPPEILVVTFTKAATEELRARIRARLIEMAALLRAETAEDQADPLLLALRDAIPAAEHPHWAQRLLLAADWMDEAAILTIHAWCYRMLREHAFAADAPLAPQLANEARALEQQAAEDYWRIFVLGLAADHLRILLAHWEHPSALAERVRPLLPLIEDLPPAPAASPAEILGPWLEKRRACLEQIKQDWRSQGHIQALAELFTQAQQTKAFNQQRLNRSHRDQVLDGLAAWLNDPAQESPAILRNKSWRRMSSLGVAEIWNDPSKAPVDHPACRALADLEAQLEGLPPAPFPELLAHAVHWIWARIEQDKQRLGFLTQQDLLVRLAGALQGPTGRQLAALIRRQFPAVMVDEFQDTDPLQYRILDAIYDIRANDPHTCLLMVGDPKQAIYGFRGADIHAYLSARTATCGRHASLDVNYRSAPGLIEAVNALFALGEGREQGPFFLRDAIPFQPARPGTDPGRLLKIQGQVCPPLSAWIIDSDGQDPVTKEDYRARSAEMTARQIVTLLRLGHRGQAILPDEQDGWRPIKAGDLAVLINSGSEAETIRQALRRLGIPSVYLSERKSVFSTWVATELLSVLRAIADPFDDGLMRQALATRLLGRSLAELDRLNNDEPYWEAEGERLRALQIRWRKQGVLPMLYRLVVEFGIAARLLGTPTGERDLTDLLHLGELLQTASIELDGEQALLRFLDEAIGTSDKEDTLDASQLRLESDDHEHLVRIVTIHKSKGLQYPLVFLPFVAHCRPITNPKPPVITHGPDHRRRVQLLIGDETRDQLERERLGEDLRKLYVALTRAQYAIWVGIGMTRTLQQSAIGYLLGASTEATGDALRQTLAHLPGVALVEAKLPTSGDETLGLECGETPPSSLAPARKIRHWRWHPWWISSYSALLAHPWADGVEDLSGADIVQTDRCAGDGLHQLASPSASVLWAPETAGEEVAREESAEALAGLLSAEAEPSLSLPKTPWPDRGMGPRRTDSPVAIGCNRPSSLHDFPRGGRYGTFLHGLLEWTATQGFASARTESQMRLALIARRCAYRRLNDWADRLDHWLCELLDRQWRLEALDAPPLCLLDLSPGRYQMELEFWLETRACNAQTIDRWISRHILPGQPRPPLNSVLLNGMLKGFIDLAFEHAGRYYVLDWKSNWLGPDDSAYTQKAMRAAIIAHRYDLQAVLYLLALHRQLRARLPDYDYDRHLGGALYVFLRGSESPTQGLFIARPPRALIEVLDLIVAGELADGYT